MITSTLFMAYFNYHTFLEKETESASWKYNICLSNSSIGHLSTNHKWIVPDANTQNKSLLFKETIYIGIITKS